MKHILAKRPRGSASLLKLRRQQRILIREEIFLLAIFLEEWYWQNRDMQENEQYKDPEFILKRWEKIRHQILGGPGFGDGYLQDAINGKMDNLLARLRKEIPYIPETEYFAYTYFVAGFDNRQVAHLVRLESDKIASAIRSRLKNEFLLMHSPYKFEYLEVLPHLPRRQLPIWQRNAIFARLCSKVLYGKSKKNQNQGTPGNEAGD
jgi:hypothetical protein